MARFIPDVIPEDIVHDSERVVYEALRGLPAGFVVLHSFPSLRPTRDLAGEPLREGEADFVILHPGRGLLVLEVKGGKPELMGRTWSRGGTQLRDPFAGTGAEEIGALSTTPQSFEVAFGRNARWRAL